MLSINKTLLPCIRCGELVERSPMAVSPVCFPCKAQRRRDYINRKNARKREFMRPEREEKEKLIKKRRALKKASLLRIKIKAQALRIKKKMLQSLLPTVYYPKNYEKKSSQES